MAVEGGAGQLHRLAPLLDDEIGGLETEDDVAGPVGDQGVEQHLGDDDLLLEAGLFAALPGRHRRSQQGEGGQGGGESAGNAHRLLLELTGSGRAAIPEAGRGLFRRARRGESRARRRARRAG